MAHLPGPTTPSTSGRAVPTSSTRAPSASPGTAIPSPPTSSSRTFRTVPWSPTASSSTTWRRPRPRSGPPTYPACSPTGWHTAARGNVESPFPKLFTVEEANALLPKLGELLEDVAMHRDELLAQAPHLEPILKASTSNGGGRVGSKYSVEAYNLYLAIEHIRELGVLL